MEQTRNIFTRIHAWCLPKFADNIPLGRLFLRFSPVFTHVISRPETAYGIEPLYNYWLWTKLRPYVKTAWAAPVSRMERVFSIAVGLTTGPLWNYFWHQMAIIIDVRWRAKKTSSVLHAVLLEISKRRSPDETIHVDVIGAGSGCYTIDAYLSCAAAGATNLCFHLLDNDPGTYDLARAHAAKRGIDSDRFASVFPFEQVDIYQDLLGSEPSTRRCDVALLIGLSDHIDKNPRARDRNDSCVIEDVRDTNQNLIEVYRRLHSVLPSDGVFITSFVSHHVEERFLAKVVKWRHRHRTWEMLQMILRLAGWAESKRDHYVAPHGIEHVVVLSKQCSLTDSQA